MITNSYSQLAFIKNETQNNILFHLFFSTHSSKILAKEEKIHDNYLFNNLYKRKIMLLFCLKIKSKFKLGETAIHLFFALCFVVSCFYSFRFYEWLPRKFYYFTKSEATVNIKIKQLIFFI